MPIKKLKPEIFADSRRLNAVFTLKNGRSHNDNRSIKGLNLGFNTDEAPEIIEANRRYLLNELSIDPDWIAFAHQVHSNRVKVVTDGGTFAETDGLITQVPGLALAIQVADCAAVLIADTKSKTIAAVHAGWRGAAADIIFRTLEKIKELDVNPENCKAFVSPCINVEDFEVGREVAEQFPDDFVDYTSFEKPHLNLKGFLKHQLIESGLQASNIEVHPDCTIESADSYYSYRREGDQSGRMMGIIQLKQMEV